MNNTFICILNKILGEKYKMIKKIVESIVIILAILTIGFIAISNLFFTSNIINDVSEQVNINKITTISLTISIFVIGIILSFRSIYTKNKIFKNLY